MTTADESRVLEALGEGQVFDWWAKIRSGLSSERFVAAVNALKTQGVVEQIAGWDGFDWTTEYRIKGGGV